MFFSDFSPMSSKARSSSTADVVVHHCGYSDTARRCQALDPCGKIYAVTIDVSRFGYDVSKVDTNAEVHSPIMG